VQADQPTTTARKTQIVIVGGGAGGLELARRLGARFGRKNHDIVLIERNLTHIWKPLLHEVAAGSLDANLDEVGYRSHGHRWGYRFFLGSLQSLDRKRRRVVVAPLVDVDGTELMAAHSIRYDYLVLAVGGVTNDFNIPGVHENCLFLDDREQADAFRHRLLNQCLRVSRTMSVDEKADEHVCVTVVGGGATGIELAAELYNSASALRHYGLEVFDEKRLQVTLLESGPRILPALPEKLAAAAHEELEALGVAVRPATRIVEARAHEMVTDDGEVIPGHLQVWAAGVKAPDFLGSLDGLETNGRSQLVVLPTLQTTLDDRVFAIGDCCFCALGEGKAVPPRAQAAHQMASATYRNLIRLMRGQAPAPFHYYDHGSLVSLSRFSTVGSLMGNLIGGRIAVEGRIARFVYKSLYRMHLLAIHGWLKGTVLIMIGRVNTVVRPKLKLH
jgi:NADH:quinone reductase (non-electrogenic)